MDVGYTTTDQIRAVLGLTSKELGDSMISDLGTADLLSLDLYTVYPDHAALKQRIDDGTATSEDQHTWLVLRMYCRYQGACHLLPQFQMIVAKKVSDGDAEMIRFGPDNLQQFKDEIRGKRDEYLQELDPTFYDETYEMYFGAVAPAYDPVTNEGGGA